jgi:hypothetical protein
VKNQKKARTGMLGYKLETTALISKDNYKAFRIRCIMLILGKLKLFGNNSIINATKD